MIVHNIKIAFRNMWKYRSQTLISVIGLGVGFTCFALAALWIVYEMTFDRFHKNAKQMYVVYTQSSSSPAGYSRITPYPLASYLKETFPDIANAISLVPATREEKMTLAGVEFSGSTIWVDSSFLRMFDVKIFEGNTDFLIPNSRNLAITQGKARQLFGEESPLGKTVKKDGTDRTICAVVSDMSKRSNYAFDFLAANAVGGASMWNISTVNTIIELLPGTNIEAFEKKLYEHNFDEGRFVIMKIIPITKLRYLDLNIEREVRFQDIQIFALSGLLVILCSLFNYLTLFVSRFRMRQKELAMRVICGASGGSLLTMLSVEFMLTLLFSVTLGFFLTQWIHEPFLALSEIQMDMTAIYREMFMYVGCVIIISLLAFRLVLLIFRRLSLNVSIRQSNRKRFRKISVAGQLVISICFTFCTLIILKQMSFLHHTADLGFSFKNRGSVSINDRALPNKDGSVLANQLKTIPEISEIVYAEGIRNLFPPSNPVNFGISFWEDQPSNAENINLVRFFVSPEYDAFFDFHLLAGEMLTGEDPDSLVLLNESAVKAFGWHDPVGKSFIGKYTVKGVISNVYNFAPTIAAKPAFYAKLSPVEKQMFISGNTTILFKYQEGMWKSCKEKIEHLFETEYIYDSSKTIVNNEEEYNKLLKSEQALIKLLSFVSGICVLICVFGFVSMVSLTCEERRKSIAIHKINGATANNILSIFAKEYTLLLFIGAIIAFTTSYFIMQRWLEQYVKQTPIPAWVYLTILGVMAMAIVLCVGWRVYKASVENPAEVVKRL